MGRSDPPLIASNQTLELQKGSVMKVRMYEGLPSDARASIDQAFKDLTTAFKVDGYGSEMGDQAEMLIDAMTEFWLCSNPSFRPHVYANAHYYENTNQYAEGCG